MEEIEYLEEYEDLVLPAINSTSGISADASGAPRNMASKGGTTTQCEDEDSSSIDQDIFESLFDDHSDDDNIMQKKADPKLSQRHEERASLDSLDMLVKDLGEQLTQSAPTLSSTPNNNIKQKSDTIKTIAKVSTSNVTKECATVSTSKTTMSTALSSSTIAKSKPSVSTSTSTASRLVKPKSVATVRPTVQQKRVNPPKNTVNRNISSTSNTPPSTSHKTGAGTSKSTSSMQSSNASSRKHISAATSTTVTSALSTKPSGSSNVQKKSRPQPTIVKPEKTQSKDPAEDPLSLDDFGDDMASDTDSFTLSDISADTYASLSDLDDNSRHIIDLSNDSSYGKINSKDLEKIRGITPSPVVSEYNKSHKIEALSPTSSSPYHSLDHLNSITNLDSSDEVNASESVKNKNLSNLLPIVDAETKDPTTNYVVSTKGLPEKATIISDTLLERIDSVLLESIRQKDIKVATAKNLTIIELDQELQSCIAITEEKEQCKTDEAPTISKGIEQVTAISQELLTDLPTEPIINSEIEKILEEHNNEEKESEKSLIKTTTNEDLSEENLLKDDDVELCVVANKENKESVLNNEENILKDNVERNVETYIENKSVTNNAEVDCKSDEKKAEVQHKVICQDALLENSQETDVAMPEIYGIEVETVLTETDNKAHKSIESSSENCAEVPSKAMQTNKNTEISSEKFEEDVAAINNVVCEETVETSCENTCAKQKEQLDAIAVVNNAELCEPDEDEDMKNTPIEELLSLESKSDEMFKGFEEKEEQDSIAEYEPQLVKSDATIEKSEDTPQATEAVSITVHTSDEAISEELTEAKNVIAVEECMDKKSIESIEATTNIGLKDIVQQVEKTPTKAAFKADKLSLSSNEETNEKISEILERTDSSRKSNTNVSKTTKIVEKQVSAPTSQETVDLSKLNPTKEGVIKNLEIDLEEKNTKIEETIIAHQKAKEITLISKDECEKKKIVEDNIEKSIEIADNIIVEKDTIKTKQTAEKNDGKQRRSLRVTKKDNLATTSDTKLSNESDNNKSTKTESKITQKQLNLENSTDLTAQNSQKKEEPPIIVASKESNNTVNINIDENTDAASTRRISSRKRCDESQQSINDAAKKRTFKEPTSVEVSRNKELTIVTMSPSSKRHLRSPALSETQSDDDGPQTKLMKLDQKRKTVSRTRYTSENAAAESKKLKFSDIGSEKYSQNFNKPTGAEDKVRDTESNKKTADDRLSTTKSQNLPARTFETVSNDKNRERSKTKAATFVDAASNKPKVNKAQTEEPPRKQPRTNKGFQTSVELTLSHISNKSCDKSDTFESSTEVLNKSQGTLRKSLRTKHAIEEDPLNISEEHSEAQSSSSSVSTKKINEPHKKATPTSKEVTPKRISKSSPTKSPGSSVMTFSEWLERQKQVQEEKTRLQQSTDFSSSSTFDTDAQSTNSLDEKLARVKHTDIKSSRANTSQDKSSKKANDEKPIHNKIMEEKTSPKKLVHGKKTQESTAKELLTKNKTSDETKSQEKIAHEKSAQKKITQEKTNHPRTIHEKPREEKKKSEDNKKTEEKKQTEDIKQTDERKTHDKNLDEKKSQERRINKRTANDKITEEITSLNRTAQEKMIQQKTTDENTTKENKKHEKQTLDAKIHDKLTPETKTREKNSNEKPTQDKKVHKNPTQDKNTQEKQIKCIEKSPSKEKTHEKPTQEKKELEKRTQEKSNLGSKEKKAQARNLDEQTSEKSATEKPNKEEKSNPDKSYQKPTQEKESNEKPTQEKKTHEKEKKELEKTTQEKSNLENMSQERKTQVRNESKLALEKKSLDNLPESKTQEKGKENSTEGNRAQEKPTEVKDDIKQSTQEVKSIIMSAEESPTNKKATPNENAQQEMEVESTTQENISLESTLEHNVTTHNSVTKTKSKPRAKCRYRLTKRKSKKRTNPVESEQSIRNDTPKPKKKSEIDWLMESQSKEMKDHGIDFLLKENPSRILTKRYLATITTPTAELDVTAKATTESPTRSLKTTVATFKTPQALDVPLIKHSNTTTAVLSEDLSRLKTKSKSKSHLEKVNLKTSKSTKSFKLRKLRVRINRTIVTAYWNKFKLQQKQLRELQENQNKASQKQPTKSTITKSTKQKDGFESVSPKTSEYLLNNDDIETYLLTPMKTATVNAAAAAIRKQQQQQQQQKRLTESKKQIPKPLTKSTTAAPATIAAKLQTVLPAIVASPASQSGINVSSSVGNVSQVETFPTVQPKLEFDEDIVTTAAIVSATETAITRFTNSASSSASSYAQQQSAVQSSTVNTSGPVSANFGVTPAAIDCNETRLYSFLHPAKYNRGHGGVLLDYCCPNLDGPMPAIDPTRIHAQVQAAVRELPAYIVMTTKLITRADVEANNGSIPASIRQKVERITASSNGAVVTAAVNSGSAVSSPVPPAAPAPTVLPLITPNISALQKQLPSTTTLTPKATPAATGAPNMSIDNIPPLTSISASSSTQNIATQQPQLVEYQHSMLRSAVRRFDTLLKKHSLRVASLQFKERQRIIENIVHSTTLSPKDMDNAVRLLEQYAAQFTPLVPSAVESSTEATAIATMQLEQLEQRTRASKQAQLPAPSTAQHQQSHMPIYDTDKNIIGYQLQAATSPAITTVATNSQNKIVIYPKPASSSASKSKSLNAATAKPNSSIKQPAQLESPRIFYTKPPMQTSTPIAGAAQSLPAVMPDNTPIASALRSTPRLGRGVTIRQLNVSTTTTPTTITDPHTLRLPTLTRNPHTSSAACSSTSTTQSESLVITTTTQPPKRLTRKTAAAAAKVVVITKDSSGNLQPQLDESILPDDNNTNTEIKREKDDDFIGGH